jgi:nitroreductase
MSEDAAWKDEEVEVDDLHPLLRSRWSPMAFDQRHRATKRQVDALLEAARWAPSAGNSQPWAFIVARRGEDSHGRVVKHLAGSSLRWAPTASLLVLNLCHRNVEGTDMDYSEFSHYDLGQAVAHMTIQATAMGLHARQFRAFRRAAVQAEFAVPDHWEVSTITAFGIPASGGAAPETAPASARLGAVRRALDDLQWPKAGDVTR